MSIDKQLRRLVKIALDAWDLIQDYTEVEWSRERDGAAVSFVTDVHTMIDRMDDGSASRIEKELDYSCHFPAAVLSCFCDPAKCHSPETLYRLFGVLGSARPVKYGEAEKLVLAVLKSPAHSSEWDERDYSIVKLSENDVAYLASKADRDPSMLIRSPDGRVKFADLMNWLTWAGYDILLRRLATTLGSIVMRSKGKYRKIYDEALKELSARNESGSMAKRASKDWQNRTRSELTPSDMMQLQQGRVPERELSWMAQCASVRALLEWYWKERNQ